MGLEPLRALPGVKAEVHLGAQGAGDHVGGTGSRLQIGNLKGGGGEGAVAVIPALSDHGCKGRQALVNGVSGLFRIGHMALHAPHLKVAAEGSAASDANHVAELFRARGLPDHNPRG